MNIGDIVSTTVISKGTWNDKVTKEVVVKRYVGKHKGKPLYSSETKHIRE